MELERVDIFWMRFLHFTHTFIDRLPSHILTCFIHCLSSLFNLSSSLAFVPIYVWPRRRPSTPISLFDLITSQHPTCSCTWKSAAGDLVGCAIGHIGWFLRDIWTREMVGVMTVFSETPVRL